MSGWFVWSLLIRAGRLARWNRLESICGAQDLLDCVCPAWPDCRFRPAVLVGARRHYSHRDCQLVGGVQKRVVLIPPLSPRPTSLPENNKRTRGVYLFRRADLSTL